MNASQHTLCSSDISLSFHPAITKLPSMIQVSSFRLAMLQFDKGQIACLCGLLSLAPCIYAFARIFNCYPVSEVLMQVYIDHPT